MKYLKRWFGIALLVLIVTLISGAVDAQDTHKFGTVSGTVSYLPKIAMTDGAEVVVQLADVSQADAPATVIASQTIIVHDRQVPFDYALTYENASIDPKGLYTVSARIYVNDDLAWISDTSYPVINNRQSSANIILVPVSASMPATEEASMTEQSPAAFGTVTGTVFYLQRIALSSDAVLQVQLSDVSRADAPAFVLASQQFVTNGRQVPLSFALNYDTDTIRENGRYTVSAKIYVDGALRWTSDTSNLVISNGVTNIDVRLVQVTG